MGRKRTSLLEDLIDLVSLLPWWVGVLLAVISYFVLQPFVNMGTPHATGITEVGALVQSQLGKTLASLGQYLLPAAFLIGAVVSLIKRKNRKALFEKVSASSSDGALNNISWQEFEMLVGEAFRRKGYSISETGGGGADGGIDLVIAKDSKSYLVQCKQWKTQLVGVRPVRELAGLVAAKKVAGGLLVTSGSYTSEARAFANESGIQLIDGKQLYKLIKNINVGDLKIDGSPDSQEGLSCPQCGSEMVKRKAKRGQYAGMNFWGCSRYPVCRGIRES